MNIFSGGDWILEVGNLAKNIGVSPNLDMLRLKIAAFVFEDGQWDKEIMVLTPPKNISMCIACLPVPVGDLVQDRFAWKDIGIGRFIVRTAYERFAKLENYQIDVL